MLHTERVQGALARLKAARLGQMVVFEPYAICYFTGKMFHPGERFVALLLKENGDHRLFNNRLFPVEEELGLPITWITDEDCGPEILASYLDAGAAVGVDKELPAKFLLPMMERLSGVRFLNSSACIDRQRRQKDPVEQERMFVSSEINDRAMAEFKKLIVPGVTELEVMNRMPDIYKSLGADEFGFGIVAFGQNAADPHHESDDTVLKKGDVVLLDVGAVKDGYNSDMTRTFFYGEPTARQIEVYNLVRRANEEAEKMIRPGVRFSEIDKTARDIISDAGFGQYFTHRLGHCIGLSVHEAGDVSGSNTEEVAPGMFFSVEPGIYLPGEFGVRIEDLVMVTEDGVKVINSYSKDIEIIE